jgi:hypothetical protein
MGARSSPEGYRVAVGRYGLPVRKRAGAQREWTIVTVLVLAATVASCSNSGGGKASAPSRPAACAIVAKLDAIADTVARADVNDPDTFNQTLSSAVKEYVSNVRALVVVAPTQLRPDLDRVEADVQQYRFDAARDDSADLDAYAATACGRVPKNLTTSTLAGSTTSVGATGATTTTFAPDSTTGSTTGSAASG